jgi:hypothetical protein
VINTATRINPLAVLIAVTILLVASIFANIVLTQNTSAADGKNFHAGRIIDDGIFYNKASMSASQIQSFLNGKVPTCDTNGTGIATEFGSNKTRAQYAADQGWQSPPYTCLRDFKMNTPQVEAASQLCGGLSAKTNRTAAQIILDISVACGINPQVLIVLLQKEQSLVTDIWPLNSQYKHATGFACPDTAPCNDAYSGFFFQTYYAAKQFKIYKAYANDYNYVAGRNNTVKWNPLSSCGTSTFFIENQATAGLYVYTPYRPNQAALDNLYGTGNSCSSYGNRNFWRLFTDWFGHTTGPLIESSGLQLYGWHTRKPTTTVFDIKNIAKTSLNVDYIRVHATNNDTNLSYEFEAKDNLVLKPGERYKYEETRDGAYGLSTEGNYSFYIDRKVGSSWYSPPFSDFNYTYASATKVTRTITHLPDINTSLQLDKSSVHVNEPVTATFTARNRSAIRTANIGTLNVEAFDASGKQYQFGANNSIVLAPGTTHSYNESLTFDKTGKYEFDIVNYNPTDGWNKTLPSFTHWSNIVRSVNVEVKNQVTLTQGLSIDQTNVREGDPMNATFKVKNFGTTPKNIGTLKVEAYGPNGEHYQFAPSENLTLAPDQEYTYAATLAAPTKGAYTFRIVNHNSALGWNSSSPTSETSSLPRSVKVNVKYPAEVTSSLSITPTSPVAGATLTATFKVQNFGTTPLNLDVLKVEAFDAAGKQYQFSPTPNLTLAPGEEYTYSQTLVLTKKDTYNFRIIHKHPQFGWNLTLPKSQNSSILRAQSITVL